MDARTDYRMPGTPEPSIGELVRSLLQDVGQLIRTEIKLAQAEMGQNVSRAKTPVMLVTSSLPAESFAKHRGMKVHADEYLDKRTVADEELVQKIDALVGLGDRNAVVLRLRLWLHQHRLGFRRSLIVGGLRRRRRTVTLGGSDDVFY